MSMQTVLFPLFVEVVLTFVLGFWLSALRVDAIRSGRVHPRDIALGEPNWPTRVTQVGNAYHDELELPLLFYVLTILSIITRHAHLLFVLLAWAFLLRRISWAFLLGGAARRAIWLGVLGLGRGLDVGAMAALCDGSRNAPPPLDDEERPRLAQPSLDAAPAPVAGDYPEWLDPYFAETFGEERAEELAALASRAPLDLRVNSLKADRDKVAASLATLHPVPTRWSPFGLRIALAADAKSPGIHAEPVFLKGQIELQDEGSQLAAGLCAPNPAEQPT